MDGQDERERLQDQDPGQSQDGPDQDREPAEDRRARLSRLISGLEVLDPPVPKGGRASETLCRARHDRAMLNSREQRERLCLW